MEWQSSSAINFVMENTIHVWSLPILPKSQLDRFFFSNDTLQGAEKFQTESSRLQYLSSRYALYRLISLYLGVDESNIIIKISPSGKPYLEGYKLYFNLSHSHSKIILAMSRSFNVGIDLEKQRPVKNYQAIARRVLDNQLIQTLNNSQNPEASFIQCWTQFEARQKLMGTGVFGEISPQEPYHLLSFKPFEQFEASLAFSSSKNLTQPKVQFYEFNLNDQAKH